MKQKLDEIRTLEVRLYDACLEIDRLKADNECLRGDLTKWLAASEESRLGFVLPMPPVVEALHKAITEAKADNARLAADHSALVGAFQHYHVSCAGVKDDTCRRCGLDLRHPVHIRYREAKE